MSAHSFARASIVLKNKDGSEEVVERNNLAFKPLLGEMAYWAWCSNVSASNNVRMRFWPWGIHPYMKDVVDDSRTRHGAVAAEDNPYSYPISSTINQYSYPHEYVDYGRMRWFNGNSGGRSQGDWPSVLAGILLVSGFRDITGGSLGTGVGNVFSHIDLNTSQIGVPYQHPVGSASIVTVAGQAWVTVNSYTNYYLYSQHLHGLLRIESGPDRGTYIFQHWDRYTGRANNWTTVNKGYLRNLDGTRFIPTSSGTYTLTLSHNRAFFNETGVIPNSTGQVFLDGRYLPGESRMSYIFRTHYEKSGSPSPASESQRGSYWLSIRPYLYGTGNSEQAAASEETGTIFSQRMGLRSPVNVTGFLWNTSAAIDNGTGTSAQVFDRKMQRMWCATHKVSNSNATLGYWNYKSTETYREIFTSVGTAGCAPAVPFVIPAGSSCRHMEMGSDGTLYAAFYNNTDTAKCGWLAVKPDLTWQWMSGASVSIPTGGSAFAAPVDYSRARVGVEGDVTSTTTGKFQSASGNFTAADLGRCIKVSGLPYDGGTWLISSIDSATEVTVTQLNGSPVAFTGESGGTFQIGDRLYLFVYNDTTWNASKMSWSDSLAFGLRFFTAVAMTNGASLGWGTNPCGSNAVVDQRTGKVFWNSVDGLKHLNMYDPVTKLVTQRPYSDLAVQIPGSSSNPTAPSTIYALGVNPNEYFRELWVSTNAGTYRFDVDNFAAQFARYWGTEGTLYDVDGVIRSEGSPTNPPGWSGGSYWLAASVVSMFQFGPDGQVFGMKITGDNVNSTRNMIIRYGREADNWSPATAPFEEEYGVMWLRSNLWAAGMSPYLTIDPYGGVFIFNPPWKNDASYWCGMIGHVPSIHYQWIDGAWKAKEVVRGPLPDSVSSPGLLAKPLHTTLEDLVMGVKIKFTSSGATGGESGEFLGRCAQIGSARTDGSTTLGSASFVCSGLAALNFQSTDLGRYYIRIETGADQGTYKLTAVTGDMVATLAKSNAVAFSATATAGTLQYTLWDQQSGSAVGPECTSFLANIGYGKDNTQDFGGVYVDMFGAKTVQSDQEEDLKFCVDLLPPKGSGLLQSSKESFYADYWGAAWAHRAFANNGYLDLFDGGVGRAADGGNGKTNGIVGSSPFVGPRINANWSNRGVSAGHLSLDFGTDVEIGSVVVRFFLDAASGYPYGPLTMPVESTYHGMHGMLVNAKDADTAALGSIAIRCSGTSNLSGVISNQTITTTGDFYGSPASPDVSGTDGQTSPLSLGANVFQSAVGKFSESNVGMALRITSGADIGYYRILTVSADGSQVTVRNLDQTAKTWSASASGVAFTVYDSVTEEDLISWPTRAAATQALVVEFISNDGKSAYVRIPPHTTITNQSWQCTKSTWKVVKRLSSGPRSAPPMVSNNKTFLCADGAEKLGQEGAWGNVPSGGTDAKAVLDLSDLPAAARTARYWRFGMMAAGPNYSHAGQAYFNSMEFYDPNGKRLLLHEYHLPDTYYSEPDFFAHFYGRIDFIQATHLSAPQYLDMNGLATLVSTVDGATVTLANGGRFLGWQVRPRGAAASAPGGSNVFNSGAGDPAFSAASDVGRTLYVQSGPNAGFYRIVSVPTASQVTVSSPSGGGVSLAADAGGTTFSIHEGFNFGSAKPDYLVFTTGGNEPGLDHHPLGGISDDLKTLTLLTNPWHSISNQTWEIRRRALENRRGTGGVDSAYSARLTFYEYCAPYQSGDVAQDSKGYVKFWAGDIGGTNLISGVAVGGTSHFQAASNNVFTQDDVGRVIVITSGVNKGSYRITQANSGNEVVLVDHFTEVPANFVQDSSVSYTILGERRFRMSRYVTSLRS